MSHKTRKLSPALSERLFFAELVRVGVLPPEKEYKFCPTRKWRADYCWPVHKIIVEVEGGVWMRGRHNRASGFIKDMEKYNEAAQLGYRLIRVQPCDLPLAAVMVKRAIDFWDETEE